LAKKCDRFFTRYFDINWVPKRQGWGLLGLSKAAELLQLQESKIPQTTNHLEGFNAALKKKYIDTYVKEQDTL